MSISPGNRDLVLAARQGLFVVDLEHPRKTPRYLPQGGSWEVADVQWKQVPHPSSAELICSTSSQKLLIWNLRLSSQNAVQQILHGHYRAITDINWHSYHENIVASCSIDSWIWVWDIRERTRKNVIGMCAWDDAATQVKWNRKHEHLLASSHRGNVLIWDDRKGALPLTTIRAHDSKVYGIDWSRTTPSQIVTCGLDKSIKQWDLHDLGPPIDESNPFKLSTCIAEIYTTYPVWRARHLPFGSGVLSLPQRNATKLEMFSLENLDDPIADFDRSPGLVKEYVWRVKGGSDPLYGEMHIVTGTSFNLIMVQTIAISNL
ncbi:WD40-repeat-containing domain protein [Cantharellus anzutake]|uniref:WD40-repeat-containing domain protein n=1 Tax=Cantharellus anzutake TaxID=1750568 RepID=UPI001908960D|nr:WD40-repeat-containing domain protein [Cantharellus anzutake]KAF8326823.1 WD40-repeat-containing domain protein [Cantharellus anzutake]